MKKRIIPDFGAINLLDQDFYKITTHHYFNEHILLKSDNTSEGVYSFMCRNGEMSGFSVSDFEKIINSINFDGCMALEKHMFSNFHIWMRGLLNEKIKTVKIKYSDCEDKFGARVPVIFSGDLLAVSMLEIFILSRVSEVLNFSSEISLYDLHRSARLVVADFNYIYNRIVPAKFRERVFFSETGTRRRFSKRYHEILLDTYKNYGAFPLSTSNIAMAVQYGLDCSGTMPHEAIMSEQGIVPLHEAEHSFFKNWANLFRYNKNVKKIALSDNYGVETFNKTFLRNILINGYSGIRHDSGDPIDFLVNIITLLTEADQRKTIDKKKIPVQIVFSEGLNPKKIRNIIDNGAFEEFLSICPRNTVVFAPGGAFTNCIVSSDDRPMTSNKNIVYKPSFINGKPVFKLSFERGKAMGGTKEILSEAYKIFQ